MSTHFLRQFDWWLILAVFVLVAFGFAAIYSVALSQPVTELGSVERQAIALGIGLVLFLFFALTNYRVLSSFAPLLFALGVVLLISVLFFGTTVRGTTGWFHIAGWSFQPVEFVKLTMIFLLARYLGNRRTRWLSWKEVILSAMIAIIPAILVLAQPDMGSALVILGTWFLLLLFAGISKQQLIVLAGSGFALFLLAWQFFFAGYQKARLLSFLHPEADPLGQGYNVAQSIIAIGSGQWVGRGLGFGSQSQLRFLPEAHTDFVLAVIAEELGLIGLLLIFIAFTILFWRLFTLAKKAHDGFTMYLLLGFCATIFLQFVVNAGMNLGLMPVTGITLPFVSYGGTSLMFFLMMIGIAESSSLRASVFGGS